MILFLALCCIAPAALVGYFLESAALGPYRYLIFTISALGPYYITFSHNKPLGLCHTANLSKF
jgi:hypothetical protein